MGSFILLGSIICLVRVLLLVCDLALVVRLLLLELVEDKNLTAERYDKFVASLRTDV